jgi:hypothetical protein
MLVESIYADMGRSEREVAKYLKELGLHWIFESPIFVYDEKDRPRVWTPDFYIPKLGIFIEVCGSEKFDYEFRERIYKKNGFFVVFVHFYKEKEKWRTYLIRRIMEIEEQRHSEVMKMINALI